MATQLGQDPGEEGPHGLDPSGIPEAGLLADLLQPTTAPPILLGLLNAVVYLVLLCHSLASLSASETVTR